MFNAGSQRNRQDFGDMAVLGKIMSHRNFVTD
jgi:hypothetical protein